MDLDPTPRVAAPVPADEDSSPLRILVANGDLATPDRDAGSLRLFRILELLVADGHRVTFIGRGGFGQERSTARLAALGIEVFPVDPERLRQLGARVGGAGVDLRRLLADRRFDLAYLSFYDVAEQYLPLIRALSPFTRVVVDTVDVHHVRERRGAELAGDPVALAAAERTRLREAAIYRAADALVAVSEDDATALHELAPGVPVRIVSTIHAPVADTPGFDARHGIVFVGSFPHAPNVDAALYFHRDVWPLVRARLPGTRLTLVGTRPPAEVLALAGSDVAVTGWVPEVAPYLDTARVSIAPLRYGAGVKGKVGEALGRGLPVVVTSIAAEGIDLRDGEHALVTDGAADFAAAVVRLHEERSLWERISAAGRAHIDARLGTGTARDALRGLLAAAVRTPFVVCGGDPAMARTVAAYATTFTPGDPTSLLVTVPVDDPSAAQAALTAAAATLAEHGLDPDAVADIQITPLRDDAIVPARAVWVDGPEHGRRVQSGSPGRRWRELAALTPAPRRPRRTARAAVLVHAPNDPAALCAQLRALSGSGLARDVELVIAADAPGRATDQVLSAVGDARVIRGTGPLGRHQAWQLAAQATAAPHVIALSPLAVPAAGFVDELLNALRAGAVAAGPLVAGAAGLRVAPDGSLWPRNGDADGELAALPFDCLAADRALFADGLPPFAGVEGHVEAQLAGWLRAQGPLAIAAGARVRRLAPPAASVVVCTRNRAEELPACLELLLAAGARDVIVVDNGCTDDTAAVAGELARRSGGVVRVVDEPRAGLSNARNAGAAAARHDLLLYIDDDARPAPGWLEHLSWALARDGVVNAGGPIAPLWPANRPAGWPGRDLAPLLGVLDLGDAERRLIPPDVVYGGNWAVRRSALGAVGGFDPQLGVGPDSRIGGEEVSVAWRLQAAGSGAMIYVPGAAVGHVTPAQRIDDGFLCHRALCVGVERPRHARAIGQGGNDRLLAAAQAAARGLMAVTPMDGDLSVADALDRICDAPAPLDQRVASSIALGELAASVALLGESEVLLGDLRLRLEGDAALRGMLPTPAAA